MRMRLFVGLFTLLCASAHGQFASFTPETGLSTAMLKLFGSNTTFASEADVRMVDKSGAETMRLPISMARLEDKVRVEVDLSKVRSKDLTPDVAESLKQIGMDKMVSIVRPDKKFTLVIYPSLRAYAEAPMSKRDAADLEQHYTMETTKIGREAIDGHACEKNKVKILGGNGQKHEATVWNATDLQRFPLQIEMKQPDATVVMHFNKPNLKKPDTQLFEAPAEFAKQPSVEKLMESAMMKALGK